MVKNIVKGECIFSKKAQPATEADKQVITDLLDTLKANKNVCVGMAANMIGINKAIQSCDHEEVRGVSDRRKLSVNRRSETMHAL